MLTPWSLLFAKSQINGLVQERRNSIANALELRLYCTNPSKCSYLLWDDADGVGCYEAWPADTLLRRQDLHSGGQQTGHTNTIATHLQISVGNTVATLVNSLFSPSTHNRHPLTHPQERGMGRLLWFQGVIYCLQELCHMQCHLIICHTTTGSNWTIKLIIVFYIIYIWD